MNLDIPKSPLIVSCSKANKLVPDNFGSSEDVSRIFLAAKSLNASSEKLTFFSDNANNSPVYDIFAVQMNLKNEFRNLLQVNFSTIPRATPRVIFIKISSFTDSVFLR